MSDSKSRRRRRRKNRATAVTVVTFALFGAVLILILVILSQSSSGSTVASNDQSVHIINALPTESAENALLQTIAPTAEVQPTIAAAATVFVTPTPEPTSTPEPFDYLPVYEHASTEEKRIAITVDDCYQMENLKTIINCASTNGAKLTLFPIGENIVRSGMAEILQYCVFDLNFEIENHTYNHARIFRMSEEEMAQQIFGQSYVLNQALGVNYQEHFFRLMGGDGAKDQRTHNYLKQLGFKGIASWSYSGSNADIDHIKQHLKPGAIFLFHTTDADLPKILEFIPYAISEGYELVTMNELLGYSDNEISELTTDATVPTPQPYDYDYATVQEGDYSWAVVLIQRKLAELGYLDSASKTATAGDPADGVYGEGTTAAIMQYQQDHGLTPTGIADSQTQHMLLG